MTIRCGDACTPSVFSGARPSVRNWWRTFGGKHQRHPRRERDQVVAAFDPRLARALQDHQGFHVGMRMQRRPIARRRGLDAEPHRRRALLVADDRLIAWRRPGTARLGRSRDRRPACFSPLATRDRTSRVDCDQRSLSAVVPGPVCYAGFKAASVRPVCALFCGGGPALGCPGRAIGGRSSMVERKLPKLHTGVRFPSPAPTLG